MKHEEKKYSTTVTVLGCILGLIYRCARTCYQTWLLIPIWGWLAVGHYGLQPITFWEAVIILIWTNLVSSKDEKDHKSLGDMILHDLIRPVVGLALAFVLHLIFPHL
jgi:cell division protein FtsW (lipid II flippase)